MLSLEVFPSSKKCRTNSSAWVIVSLSSSKEMKTWHMFLHFFRIWSLSSRKDHGNSALNSSFVKTIWTYTKIFLDLIKLILNTLITGFRNSIYFVNQLNILDSLDHAIWWECLLAFLSCLQIQIPMEEDQYLSSQWY